MDLLWNKDASGLYKNIFASVNKVEVLPGISPNEVSMNCEKKDIISIKLRQAGNAKVCEDDWYSAMILYNQSLCHAETNSETVSLAYANRSLCFFKMNMYDKCLTDIEMAINANYPERLLPKLRDRRRHCFKHMKNALPNKEQKLDFEEDENFPGMANVLQMTYNKKFGRHLIATCDIDVGKIVMLEESFVKFSLFQPDFSTCETCYKTITNFIACPNCTSALFCSEDCANDLFHMVRRCGRSDSLDNNLVEFVLKSILRARDIMYSVEEWIQFVENAINEMNVEAVPLSTVSDKLKYRVFLNLNQWLPEHNKTKTINFASEAFDTLMSIPNITKSFDTRKKKRFLMHLCVMHFCLVCSNSFKTEKGASTFLLRNHLNHSCAPNLLCRELQSKNICITSRRIKKGDQLFISYGDSYKNPFSLHERQFNLWHDFAFRCECEKCQNTNWPISSLKVQSDPDFQNIVADLRRCTLVYSNNAECVSLKRKCIEVLKKYSDIPWCTELDLVSTGFQIATSERFL